MTSLLTHAVRLVRVLVDEEGSVATLSSREAAMHLQLPLQLADPVLENLIEIGLLTKEGEQLSPTVAGISLGVEVAKAAKQVHGVDLRPRRPYWTYTPQEVNLKS